MLFLIAALRAIIEMLGLCLIGQGMLALLAGSKRQVNPIYRLFALITHAPRRVVAHLLPNAAGEKTIGICCFVVLFCLWIGLALMRKFV